MSIDFKLKILNTYIVKYITPTGIMENSVYTRKYDFYCNAISFISHYLLSLIFYKM